MKVKNFEKRISHLTQQEILAYSVSSLNKLLVDKGIVTRDELQKYFLEWMESRPVSRKRPLKNSRWH